MAIIKFKCKNPAEHSSEKAGYVYFKTKKAVPKVTIQTANNPQDDWEFIGSCGDGHEHSYFYFEKI